MEDFAIMPLQLPLWLDYVKALGTPTAALVAATVTGSFAYKQWRTAQNKLKLDLFGKRFEVYEAGIQLIREIVSPSAGNGKRLTELTKETSGAKWLLNAQIAQHLDELMSRAWTRLAIERDLDEHGILMEQREHEISEYQIDVQEFVSQERAKPDEKFDKFLHVEH